MLRTNFIFFLLLSWKLSTVFIFPAIIYFYLILMTFYTDSFTFQQLDQGSNVHKGIVVIVYVIYLLVWKILNGKVKNYLKKFEYS
jgi:hypothetical protein